MPDDFAIVGYDDIEFAAAAAVPLSSVRQPRAQLGRTAAELLLEEATGDASTTSTGRWSSSPSSSSASRVTCSATESPAADLPRPGG